MKRSTFTTNQTIHRGYLPPAVEPGQIWLVVDHMEPVGREDGYAIIRKSNLKNVLYINAIGRNKDEWDVSFIICEDTSKISHKIETHNDIRSRLSDTNIHVEIEYLLTQEIYKYCSFVA